LQATLNSRRSVPRSRFQARLKPGVRLQPMQMAIVWGEAIAPLTRGGMD